MKHFLGKTIVMLLFIIVIGSIFTGCEIQYIMNHSEELKKEDAKKFTIEKAKVDALTKIDISSSVADVELIQSDDYYVEIDYTYWDEAPEYTIENGVLHFDDSDSFPDSYSINFNLNNVIKVYLPDAAPLDLVQLNNASGNVSAAGFMADKLDVSIAYGDLTLENAAAADCDIRLASGNSKITDFNACKLEYSNSYGNAEFKNINTGVLQLPDNETFDSFNISMSSGNIDIKGLYCNSAELSNSYGNVTCDQITSEKFDASLSSGNIDISKADLKDISVSNSYGDVTMSLTGTKEDYNMDLKTSYGNITVDGKNYEDSLNLENGGIRDIKADLSSGDVNIKFN